MANYFPPLARFGAFEANVLQGIPGGIPTRSGGVQIDAVDFGFAEGNTAAANSAALTAACMEALNNDGSVVNMPAGVFDLGTPSFGVPTLGNRRYTLRGAGVTGTTWNTVINMAPGGSMYMEASTDFGSILFNPDADVASITSGSNILAVDDASEFPSS